MNKFKALAVVAALSAHASHAVSADVSAGVVRNVVSGQSLDAKATQVGFDYASYTLGGGLSSKVSGPYSAVLNVKTEFASDSVVFKDDLQVKPKHAYEAALGVNVDGEEVSLFVGPLYRVASLDVSMNDAKTSHSVDGLGATASLSYMVNDYAGFKLNVQHVINQSVSAWGESDLGDRLGPVFSGSSQVGVAFYSNVVHEV